MLIFKAQKSVNMGESFLYTACIVKSIHWDSTDSFKESGNSVRLDAVVAFTIGSITVETSPRDREQILYVSNLFNDMLRS